MQDAADRLVLNADDAHTALFASQARSSIRYFSRRHSVVNGAFSVENLMYAAHDCEVKEIMPTSGILIPGDHNIENYLAAYAATGPTMSPTR